MAEWPKAAVSKTVNGATRSGVRIPLSPPLLFYPQSLVYQGFIRTRPFWTDCRQCANLFRDSGKVDKPDPFSHERSGEA